MMRTVLACAAAAVLGAGCAPAVDGRALPDAGSAGTPGIDAGTVLLGTDQMRAITGGGEDLFAIPGMDGTAPVDVPAMTDSMPPDCRFLTAETVTFGPDVANFRKTTYQYPPRAALISQGAASYPDAAAARGAFARRVETVQRCAADEAGAPLVGDWSTEPDALRMRPGDCGRDYRLVSTLLVEVTFCGFGESVPATVMTNILARVPGR